MLRLDVGCGANKREEFLGVDIRKTKNVDVVADALYLPFRDAVFDYVYSRRCIQHIKDDVNALKEMYRVLKNHGKLELIVASIYGFLYYKLGFSESSGNYQVFHLYFKHKLRKMLKKAGFTSIDIMKVKSIRKLGYDLKAICKR